MVFISLKISDAIYPNFCRESECTILHAFLLLVYYSIVRRNMLFLVIGCQFLSPTKIALDRISPK